MAAGPGITAIGFDADDTLWQNETFFRMTEQRFAELLSGHGEHHVISARLLEAERRNLRYYGYGVKGFTLSMIETAVEVTRGEVPSSVIAEILSFGRQMLENPVETLPHARETLDALAGRYRILLITKGDLFDQERKLAQSGLGEYFNAVEIVSEKTPGTYERIFTRHADGPGRAVMVGNSLKSDVVPAIAAGGYGIHVPHELTWILEHEEAPEDNPRFRRIEDLAQLPPLLGQIT
ncbi:HAD family hydrolase [Aestuariivirga sp.]|uniref:HAD family hydrolase n=1 Tax=Aestuariivirga sp. TaxID=2650926 RepID=UPI003919D817